MLCQLGQEHAELSLGEVVSLDGKSARHSCDKGAGKGDIHMISAWASENQLVLCQVKVADKSNEITPHSPVAHPPGCLGVYCHP